MSTALLKGQVGQCTSCNNPEHVGKWFFEFSMGSKELGQFGPYDSQEIAQREMDFTAHLISASLIDALRTSKTLH